MNFERVVIIRDKTRLEQLIERFNSKAQAKFYIEHSEGDFGVYEREHQVFYQALERLEQVECSAYKTKVIFRSFLPNYLFSDKELVLVLGQDGLVANTAKYANTLPILGVNPNPDAYDGILLKHAPENVAQVLERCSKGAAEITAVTLAEAQLNDGQRLLAFNDFYIGANSHVSSRYKIHLKGQEEQQSSSGIIISTGAGATGWMSSVVNMFSYENTMRCHEFTHRVRHLTWTDEQLVFVVREPFKSKVTQTDIGFGTINRRHSLVIESLMPMKGVIFSDGIEADFLHFNSGAKVTIGIADQKAHLII